MRRLTSLLLFLVLAASVQANPLPKQLYVKLSRYVADKARHHQVVVKDLVNISVGDLTLTPVFYEPKRPDVLARYRDHELNCWFKLSTPRMEAAELATRLHADRNIVDWNVSIPLEAYQLPNDFYINDMWALSQMECPLAWDISTGSSDILVSSIDTGIEINHPDLMANQWVNPGEDINGNGVWDDEDNNGVDDDQNGFVDDVMGWDFVSETGMPSEMMVDGEDYDNPDNQAYPDVYGHGTHTGGILAGVTDNEAGICSASWNVTNIPIKTGFAFEFMGQLSASLNPANVAQGIQYAVDNGARIISLSLGSEQNDPTIEAAIQYAHDMGVVIFAAAGNNGSTTPTYPASLDGVISVAASTYDDVLWEHTNRGDWIDLCAPGVDIWSTMSNNANHAVDYESASGTSMAAPMAASVAALILSYDPTLTADEVENVMISTCDDMGEANPGLEGQYGAGRVNARRALEWLENPLLAPVDLTASLDTTTGTVHLTWSAPPSLGRDGSQGELDEFQCYNVYRNGEIIGGPGDPEWTDTLPDSGTYIYVVTGQYDEGESPQSNGVSITWAGMPSSVAPEQSMPDDFALEAVYPNPFNAQMRATVSVPVATHLRAEIYTIGGRRVAVLCNGPVAPGRTLLDWNAGDMASGVYLLNVMAGGQWQASRKLVLVK